MFIPYQKERLENVICFFAKEHRAKTRKPLYQTYLYKYLAFFEFEILEESGEEPLGLKYTAFKKGPVAIDIYNKRRSYKTELFEFKPSGDNYIILHKNKYDLKYFSDYEIDKLNELIEIYADHFVNSNIMSEASHEKIKAWKRAYKRAKNGEIDNINDTFGDISNKPVQNLTFAEENLLMQKAIEKKLCSGQANK